ncbi:MAG: hypothetical protein A4E56_03234 [Pelotomaculum sp. PtaU1.Bin065]|nr:MAG: hypothetical protein A4E56_03234 [Pelotomaculum sp. PtaU1.Bin065]
MKRYFAHLPDGLLKVVSAKEPVIQLINSKHCTHYQSLCAQRINKDFCSIGDKQCIITKQNIN